MTITEPRADLVRGLLQSCYVIEHARCGVQSKWGGDFDRDAASTLQRAKRLGELLDELKIRRPDEVIEGHTAWFESLCGSRPDEVPLGAAVIHQFGKWADVFAGPHLGDDLADFHALGQQHTRVETELRAMTEDEAFLPANDLPDGKRFAILTDMHVGSKYRDVLARSAVAEINEIGPDFVVVPGDFTEDGEPEQFALAKEILDGLSCPYYVVLGNHDAVQRSSREPRGEEFYQKTFGSDAQDHIVECGDLQVALVDSTDPTASPFPDWDIASGRIGEGVAAGVDSGALKEGQAEELAGRLDRTKPVLLIQHHELHPFPGFPPVKFALREEDAKAELDALKDHNLIGVVAGHTHRSAVLKVGDGPVTQLEIPALKDWPFAYSVVGINDGGVQVVARQIADRDAVWRMSKGVPPLIRRFALSPLSDLSYTFAT
jgi:predicted phosphodiesterase